MPAFPMCLSLCLSVCYPMHPSTCSTIHSPPSLASPLSFPAPSSGISPRSQSMDPPAPLTHLTNRAASSLRKWSTDDGLFSLQRQLMRWAGLVATLGSGCAMALTGGYLLLPFLLYSLLPAYSLLTPLLIPYLLLCFSIQFPSSTSFPCTSSQFLAVFPLSSLLRTCCRARYDRGSYHGVQIPQVRELSETTDISSRRYGTDSTYAIHFLFQPVSPPRLFVSSRVCISD